MERPEPVAAARALVAERFPDAVQAWLSGSVVLGRSTATSDLDVTVLLRDTVVRRESLRWDGWPIELFVHTEDSVRAFVAKDVARRRPTMARLVATGVPLRDGPGGSDLQRECAAVVEAGPGLLPSAELDYARYSLTDCLDDLAGGGPPHALAAVAVLVWQQTAELLLASRGWWSGGGKWLVRELEACDQAHGSSYSPRLHDALRAAIAGDPAPLTAIADEVLGSVGGQLWEGYAATAP
jgi:hypothetical protein